MNNRKRSSRRNALCSSFAYVQILNQFTKKHVASLSYFKETVMFWAFREQCSYNARSNSSRRVLKIAMNITLAQAETIVAAAKEKSAAIDTKMNIAVVDAGANLVAFARMDGAWLGSLDISIKKAKTARYFDMNTGDIGGLSQPGGPLYNIEHSNGGLITFPGGVPIKNAAGEIIGAIGVSGSSVENDHAVADAGAAAI